MNFTDIAASVFVGECDIHGNRGEALQVSAQTVVSILEMKQTIVNIPGSKQTITNILEMGQKQCI